ncbi:MAG: SRPBCC domain-containing protein, partial [Candidatus Binataceae bacterium]
MAPESNLAEQPSELELVITRIFDAPRSLVFKAWTAPEHLVRWWGPRGFTLPSCEIDPRPGGTYLFHMRGPEGDDHWSRGFFRELVEPERLVMEGAWVDAQGKPKGPETLVTVTFEEHDGKT